jgi:hypothetical protein
MGNDLVVYTGNVEGVDTYAVVASFTNGLDPETLHDLNAMLFNNRHNNSKDRLKMLEILKAACHHEYFFECVPDLATMSRTDFYTDSMRRCSMSDFVRVDPGCPRYSRKFRLKVVDVFDRLKSELSRRNVKCGLFFNNRGARFDLFKSKVDPNYYSERNSDWFANRSALIIACIISNLINREGLLVQHSLLRDVLFGRSGRDVVATENIKRERALVYAEARDCMSTTRESGFAHAMSLNRPHKAIANSPYPALLLDGRINKMRTAWIMGGKYPDLRENKQLLYATVSFDERKWAHLMELRYLCHCLSVLSASFASDESLALSPAHIESGDFLKNQRSLESMFLINRRAEDSRSVHFDFFREDLVELRDVIRAGRMKDLLLKHSFHVPFLHKTDMERRHFLFDSLNCSDLLKADLFDILHLFDDERATVSRGQVEMMVLTLRLLVFCMPTITDPENALHNALRKILSAFIRSARLDIELSIRTSEWSTVEESREALQLRCQVIYLHALISELISFCVSDLNDILGGCLYVSHPLRMLHFDFIQRSISYEEEASVDGLLALLKGPE